MFMKKQNKKRGFTITELVVVISVIAILSAVLIPTFSGIIAKSKMSADQQAVRQMNVQLSTITEENSGFETALEVLDEAGYNALDTLVPVSKNHAFYWDNEAKTIVLVDADKNVVYPKDHKNAYSASWKNLRDDGVKEMPNVNITETTDLITALDLGAKKVTLTEDMTIKGTIAVAEGANTVIDLNGKTLDASKNSARPFDIFGDTTLTIDATGSEVKVGKYGLVNVTAGSNANITINGGTYTANKDSENGAFIKVRPNATANITLNNVNYIDTTGENYLMNALDAESATVTVNGGTYQAFYGFNAYQVNISDATIITEGKAIDIEGNAGDSTLTNCKITAGDAADNAGYAAYGAIFVSNSNKLTADNCEITTNGDIVAYFVANTGGEIIATNAKGAVTTGSTTSVDAGKFIKITVNGEEKVNK